MPNQWFAINLNMQANNTARQANSRDFVNNTAVNYQGIAIAAPTNQKDQSLELQSLDQVSTMQNLVIVNSYLYISIFSDSSLIKFNVYSQISYKI